MNASELLDPTAERAPALRERAPRPTSLDECVIGLVDINKARGDVFLDRIEEHLVGRGLRVERFVKPTFTKVMPLDLAGEIAARTGVVIEALAD